MNNQNNNQDNQFEYNKYVEEYTVDGENAQNEDGKKKRKTALLIILAFVLIVVGSVFFGYYLYEQYTANRGEQQMSQLAQTTTTQQTTESQKATNPIDFASLTAQNSDIYSWIVVPNTNVDYPVVQHTSDDSFYLKHEALTKKWQSSGAIYTQIANKKDYSDCVTVIYGHNGYGDTMFTTLHRFENKEFFDENEYFYIYTENSKLTYQIISAFKYSDRHLLNTFNLQDLAVRDQFMQMLQNPESSNKNVRTELDTTVDRNSNIVILSTCITNQKQNRYLVCGVLVNNEQTN